MKLWQAATTGVIDQQLRDFFYLKNIAPYPCQYHRLLQDFLARNANHVTFQRCMQQRMCSLDMF